MSSSDRLEVTGCPRKGSLFCFLRRTIFLAVFFSVSVYGQAPSASPGTKERPVLLELFTAEGCSSCPPADKLMGEMTNILKREGINVIGLSFHITYWNRHGWQDPYSQEIFTDRQKEYVKRLTFTQVGSPQVYTPQAVINGTREFVGSNAFKFRENALAAAEAGLPLKIQATITRGDSIRIDFVFNRSPRNNVLNAAVIEHDVETVVTAGENKNKTLKHNNVVRLFKTINEPQKEGTLFIVWPKELSTEDGGIVLYSQEMKTYKVTGVALVAP